eukprot:GILK01014168.1.p1 GENE.GILK01014168.1~~GILK01014168.1.p1  ORF type:complete len:756 (-),score=147.99 GILK01014168.1:51-2318(-)
MGNSSSDDLKVACENGDLERVKNAVAWSVTDAVNQYDEFRETMLLYAARAGQADVVEFLLSKNANVHLRNQHEETALIVAAECGNCTIIKALIDHGADVGAVDKFGSFPLWRAAGQHPTACAVLLNHGANVNQKHVQSGKTALHRAAATGCVPVAQLLLERGADPAVHSKRGDSALRCALEKDRSSLTKLLLTRGVRWDKDKDPFGLLRMAACKGHISIIEYMINRNSLEDVAQAVNYALGVAVKSNQTKLVQFLSAEGADLNALFEGLSLLMLAVQNSNQEVLVILLEAGANINQKVKVVDSEIASNWSHETVLSYALRRRKTTLVRYLVESGANVADLPSICGWFAINFAAEEGQLYLVKALVDTKMYKVFRSVTPLPEALPPLLGAVTPLSLAASKGHNHIVQYLLSMDDCSKDWIVDSMESHTPLLRAVINGHLDATRTLIQHKVNLECRTQDGYTPLLVATARALTAIVKVLGESGADVDAMLEDGRTALFIALERQAFDIASVLLGSGADSNHIDKESLSPLQVASSIGRRDFIFLLIRHKADVNYRDADGRSALHFASCFGDRAAVQELIDSGATIDLPSRVKGYTPFMEAAINGHIDVMECLMKAGANVQWRDELRGITPLMLASRAGHVESVQWLLDHDAEVNARERNYGATALLFASSRGQTEVVHVLLRARAKVDLIHELAGQTALMVAAKKGYLDCVKLLLENGANVDLTDKQGRSAFQIAADNKQNEIVKYFTEIGIAEPPV